jgi:hypothetical protein
MTRASARRLARRAVRQRSRRAAGLRSTCTPRGRTSATCRVRWRVGATVSYRGTITVSYGLREGAPSALLRARLSRRVTSCGWAARRCARTVAWSSRARVAP